MKQASSRELFGYWTARRGKRPAPERGEIEPSAIRRALGDVFILEFERHQGHPFRLAGTRVCALFGRELKNQPLLGLWDAQSRLALANLLDTIADEANGVVAAARGRTPEGWVQDRLAGAAHRAVLARLVAARRPDAWEYPPSQSRPRDSGTAARFRSQGGGAARRICGA
jgi:hypothetical protein